MGVLQSGKDLPEDRLATTDERGKRLMVHPADVKGTLRNRRSVVSFVLLVVFLALPWVRIGGHQALLLDVSRRQFAIFGLAFWAHDAPMVVFVLLSFVLALLFMTSVWGRVWCGWGCPQTVFVDAVFRRIERLVEGDGLARRKLAQEPWGLDKLLKRSSKWFLYTACALLISHSFLAYFVGTDELARMVRLNPAENWGTFLFMGFVTAIVLFDFGWFREQFCIVMCPYGRLQSVLMDQKSMTVAYDEARGEPRRGRVAEGQTQGDCVSCARCVQVCPTGIDIRRGPQQLECIACTACIDACDEVMIRVGKPKGLIGYRGAWRKPGMRSWAYFAVLLAVLGGLAYVVTHRRPLDVTVLRAKDAPYSIDASGALVNHFRFHVTNRSFGESLVTVASLTEGVTVVRAEAATPIAGGKQSMLDTFVRFPAGLLKSGHGRAVIEFSSPGLPTERKEIDLVGPFH